MAVARTVDIMRDAVIIGAVRTAVGRRNGGLSGVHPVDLSAHVLRGLAARAGLDPADVEDVIWGCVSQVGEQSWNIARNAVLAAGWPESVPGTTLDRQCGSSQQALHFAAATVLSGQADLVVAGGVGANRSLRERMSQAVARQGVQVFYPRIEFCTDNAAMIAGLGYHLFKAGRVSDLYLDAVPTKSHRP
jgi:acetyl-CoA acetyltransferase